MVARFGSNSEIDCNVQLQPVDEAYWPNRPAEDSIDTMRTHGVDYDRDGVHLAPTANHGTIGLGKTSE
jgi:hypothetical protein